MERITSFYTTHIFYVSRSIREIYEELGLGPRRGAGVADVCVPGSVGNVFASHRAKAVFQAAAHNFVPMMGWNR